MASTRRPSLAMLGILLWSGLRFCRLRAKRASLRRVVDGAAEPQSDELRRVLDQRVTGLRLRAADRAQPPTAPRLSSTGMGRRDGSPDLVRIIRGERGRVAVR